MTVTGAMTRREVLKGSALLAANSLTTALRPSEAAAAAVPVTFVVAHGAWSAGWAWKKMLPLMSARGHRLLTPNYTGLGERAHLANSNIDLETHINDIVNVLVYEDLHNVVLVGHSYGGMVCTGVADRARDRISRLIYLDAFVPDDGQSLFDLTGQNVEQSRASALDGWRVAPNPLPPDTPHEDLPWIAARRMPQPIKTFEQALRLTKGPLTVPRRYVQCTKSETFRPYFNKAKAAGWPVYELASSHNPHITVPTRLADLLDRIGTRD